MIQIVNMPDGWKVSLVLVETLGATNSILVCYNWDTEPSDSARQREIDRC